MTFRGRWPTWLVTILLSLLLGGPAAAQDGVQVPVSLVYRKDQRQPGKNPLYVYGYGSYGYALPMGFNSNRLGLLVWVAVPYLGWLDQTHQATAQEWLKEQRRCLRRKV